MEYGLIGAKLRHSFSKEIHEQLTDYTYDLCPLANESDVAALLCEKNFKAINVTIPYKEFVLPFCDEIDEKAREIGAVNTIVNRGGKLFGTNTDFAGFLYLVHANGVSLADKTVLILGTGGTQKTVEAAAKSVGAKQVLRVSRTKTAQTLTYAEAAARRDVQIIVNTSPVGMYPQNGACLLDLSGFPALEAVFDAVYNPLETRLLWQARQLGVKAANGLLMLVAQAKYAAEYFLNTTFPDSEIKRITDEILKQRMNLILIGMPGSGKSVLGRRCAALLKKPFIDLDDAVESRANTTIAALFASKGEDAFRALEHEICAEISKETGQVIATGGGIVKNADNVRLLRQNGVLIFIDRPTDTLATGASRPLSPNTAAVQKLYAERLPLYRAAADVTVENSGALAAVATKIKEAFDETACFKRPESELSGHS
ncbi:MAG: shikimate kinase [Ruthenibacterium sp.]